MNTAWAISNFVFSVVLLFQARRNIRQAKENLDNARANRELAEDLRRTFVHERPLS